MGESNQRRIIRKLDLELFIASLTPQPTPQAHLEQYTTSEAIAANMLYLATYTNGDIIGKSIIDLGCGTGRLGLGAAFLGAKNVVGVDVDRLAVKTAYENSEKTFLTENTEWINGDIASISGKFDTVLQNPPFGVQTREADRAFLLKALEVGSSVYSFHNHPEVDLKLVKLLKNQDFIQVSPSPFLEQFISKHGGYVKAVYSMCMTIPKLFSFHKKMKYDFIIDLYVIKKL
ncbi:MAG: METTL5 family protein [Candidatus Bathyarchaeota archaeon]|nr:METTL5 family protein [Candidatus Bathyarchaeota archaeon]MDD4325671.1 METTL5 family protein [Candidatus Bathyarchaeota archaeon]MDT8781698.1 methyltransferase [Candidatus Bathyarchaeota archaeon]NLD65715.1 methyltransferase [Thermoproteota archaeon]